MYFFCKMWGSQNPWVGYLTSYGRPFGGHASWIVALGVAPVVVNNASVLLMRLAGFLVLMTGMCMLIFIKMLVSVLPACMVPCLTL